MFIFITLFGLEISSKTVLYSVFGLIIFIFLLLDLGIFNKKDHIISTRSAFWQSLFWVGISTLFGVLIYLYPEEIIMNGTPKGSSSGFDPMIEYFSAYLTEYALSIDNIFVMLLVLKYFSVKEKYYHRVLFYGILGAIIFRGIFIFIGAYFIAKFHWILYVFGVFLIYSGIKIYFEHSHEKVNPKTNFLITLCRKYLPITSEESHGRFIVRQNGKIYYTPLFLVIILIETTDLIFAMDSIPATFAITQNEFLIYTSNIFAVMGLRALFFLLSGVITRFYLLQKGLSLILVFIGVKMLLEIVHFEIPPILSFCVIVVTLASSIIISVVIPQKGKGLLKS